MLKEFHEFNCLLLLCDIYLVVSSTLSSKKFCLSDYQVEWSRWNWIFLIGYNSIWIQEVGQNFIINHINHYIYSNLISKEVPKINAGYLKCRDHYFNKNNKADVWADVRSKCSFCIKYEIWDKFHNDMLPGQKEILEYLLIMKNKANRKARTQVLRSCNGFKIAMDILQCISWVWMPSKRRSIILSMKTHSYLMKVSKNKKKCTYWTYYSTCISNQTSVCFFFYLGFLSQTFMIHRTGEGGRISLSLFSTISTHFTDTLTLAGQLLQRAHLYT